MLVDNHSLAFQALDGFLDVIGNKRANFFARDGFHDVAVLAKVKHHQRHAVFLSLIHI